MTKFRIVGDSSSNPFHSSRIIISSTNEAAKRQGLYDENGVTVVYDTLCNNHGYKADAFWCAYELPIPRVIKHNAGGKPMIGLSKENAWMFVFGGYPAELCYYATLGCDTSLWYPEEKKKSNKFIVGCSIESTVRSDIPIIIKAFGECFRGSKDIILHIKDRNATPLFETYVKEKALEYNVNIFHENRQIEDFAEERRLFAAWDVHLYLNRSGTFCLTVLQGMACGTPTISCRYSGPSDYLSHRLNGMAVEYDLVPVTSQKLHELESIGMRNYLFPPTIEYYESQPFWAEFRLQSLKDSLLELKEDKNLREILATNGRQTAQWLSWDRTALNMSFVLKEFEL